MGQAFAFVLLLVLISCGTYLIYVGRDLGGFGAIVATIAGVIVVFLKGRRSTEEVGADPD
jgi:hypothetical protein